MNAAESASNDASTSTVGNKASNGESNNASGRARGSVDDNCRGEEWRGEFSREGPTTDVEFSVRVDGTAAERVDEEEKKGKTRRKKPRLCTRRRGQIA